VCSPRERQRTKKRRSLKNVAHGHLNKAATRFLRRCRASSGIEFIVSTSDKHPHDKRLPEP
jgi:hypothetical protein